MAVEDRPMRLNVGTLRSVAGTDELAYEVPVKYASGSEIVARIEKAPNNFEGFWRMWNGWAKDASGDGHNLPALKRKKEVAIVNIGSASFFVEDQLAGEGGYKKSASEPFDEPKFNAGVEAGLNKVMAVVDSAKVSETVLKELSRKTVQEQAELLQAVREGVASWHANPTEVNKMILADQRFRTSDELSSFLRNVFRQGGVTNRAESQLNRFRGVSLEVMRDQIIILQRRLSENGNLLVPSRSELDGGEVAFGPLKQVFGVEVIRSSFVPENADVLQPPDLSRPRVNDRQAEQSPFGMSLVHSLEDYEREGVDRGIFGGDEAGRGFLSVIGNPIISFTSREIMRAGGEYDILIEFNKVFSGLSTPEQVKSLINSAWQGPEHAAKRWMVGNIAEFLRAIYALDNSADYTKFVGDKGLLNGLDPRAIGHVGKVSEDFRELFKEYLRFFKQDLINNPVDNYMKEKELRQMDQDLAEEIDCSVGFAMLARHFVTDVGIVPQPFTQLRRAYNRYPGIWKKLLLRPGLFTFNNMASGDRGFFGKMFEKMGVLAQYASSPTLQILSGFALVDINGSRTVLLKKLFPKNGKEEDIEGFFNIYSDDSGDGNGDDSWTKKMWSMTDVMMKALDAFKNTIGPNKGLAGKVSQSRVFLGMQPQFVENLKEVGFLSVDQNGHVVLPWLKDLQSSQSGTKLAREPVLTALIRYLYNLIPEEDGGSPLGPLKAKWQKGFLNFFGNNEISKALASCLVSRMNGLGDEVISMRDLDRVNREKRIR